MYRYRLSCLMGFTQPVCRSIPFGHLGSFLTYIYHSSFVRIGFVVWVGFLPVLPSRKNASPERPGRGGGHRLGARGRRQPEASLHGAVPKSPLRGGGAF